MAKPKLKIFVGYDAKEHANYEVLVHSIQKHTTINVEVIPIIQSNLRATGIYTRPVDVNASNEFSITRFLTPYLSYFKGYSLFMDCDMCFTRCPSELLTYANKEHALTVVKHQYVPKESSKFLGQKQEAYPRKNWSSFVLWNCGHELTKQLKPDLVNKATPAFLHRFEHFPNETIGAFPLEMNWLVGEYDKMESRLPFNIHWTIGSPMWDEYKNCDYGDLWNEYYKKSQEKSVQNKLVLVHKNTKAIARDVLERERIKEGGCNC